MSSIQIPTEKEAFWIILLLFLYLVVLVAVPAVAADPTPDFKPVPHYVKIKIVEAVQSKEGYLTLSTPKNLTVTATPAKPRKDFMALLAEILFGPEKEDLISYGETVTGTTDINGTVILPMYMTLTYEVTVTGDGHPKTFKLIPLANEYTIHLKNQGMTS